MNARAAASAAWLGWLAAAPALAQAPVIRLQPLECVPAGMRARVTACVEPVEAVMTARLLFRAAAAGEWQTVAMKRDEGCFSAPLPVAPADAGTVTYAVEVVDPTMVVVRSPETRVPVRSRRQCDVAATFSGPQPQAPAKPDTGGRKKSPLLLAVVGGGVAAGGAAALISRSSGAEPAASPSPTPEPAPQTPPPTTLPPPTTTTTRPAPTTTTLPPPTTTAPPSPTTTVPPPTSTSTTTTTTTPTTTTTTTPTTTTTTPTTTTTTLPGGCTYSAAPDRSFTALPSTGDCRITATPSNCRWRADVRPGDADWLDIDGDDNGMGNGNVRYRLEANLGVLVRMARIELRENPAIACTITQAGITLPEGAPAQAVWTSHLDVAGGRGELTVDGAQVRVQERGVLPGRAAPRTVHHLEARLVAAAGRPGVWRFEVGGTAVPGTLRPLAGNVVQLSGGVVLFRLEGRPGERVAFTWRAR
jgi:hypothetical protein